MNTIKVENEKSRKSDLIANEMSLIHKCKVKIISYGMTFIVTKYHKNTEVKIEFSFNNTSNR